MKDLIPLFIDHLLPVLLAASAGYALSKTIGVDPRTLSRVIFYIFSPCLIFDLLTKSHLSNGEILRVMSLTSVSILSCGAIALIICWGLRLDRSTRSVVLLTSMFMNAGNFGLSVVLFALGQQALSYASLFFVTSAILAYTLGVMIASMGSASMLGALRELSKLPVIYALVIALFFVIAKWQVPVFIERTISLLAEASIPAMLVLLGMQLSKVVWSNRFVPIVTSSVVRLIISPALIWFLAPLFQVTGVVRQAGVLEAAMPSAVLTTMLATEYNLQPQLVTMIVLITTLLSPLTITPLLALLGV